MFLCCMERFPFKEAIMTLYRVDKNNSVSQIKPSGYSKERELQKLFEANLIERYSIPAVQRSRLTGAIRVWF